MFQMAQNVTAKKYVNKKGYENRSKRKQKTYFSR
jgi:hypothetical protein